LAWQFPNWFLNGPLIATASKLTDYASGREPEEPFEPDPRYLDPTHDEPVRFSKVGARCGAVDPNCLPIPYNGDPKLVVGSILHSRYKPNARRTPVSKHRMDPGTEACAHDGDCLTVGDGRCVRWDSELGQIRGVRAGLLEAYCGCVQKQCQWFTQPRPAIHVNIKTRDLEGWPGRLPIDREDMHYAMGGYVQGEIERCFVNHLKQLPQTIVLSVEQKRDRERQTGHVKGAPQEVAQCIERMFPSVSVNLGEITDAELAQHPITLTATFVVSVKTVP
jgi:hypothetical protein